MALDLSISQLIQQYGLEPGFTEASARYGKTVTDEVKAKVAQDVHNTYEYAKSRKDGTFNAMPINKTPVIADYTAALVDHHATHGNVNMLKVDDSHLYDSLRAGKPVRPLVTPPAKPTGFKLPPMPAHAGGAPTADMVKDAIAHYEQKGGAALEPRIRDILHEEVQHMNRQGIHIEPGHFSERINQLQKSDNAQKAAIAAATPPKPEPVAKPAPVNPARAPKQAPGWMRKQQLRWNAGAVAKQIDGGLERTYYDGTVTRDTPSGRQFVEKGWDHAHIDSHLQRQQVKESRAAVRAAAKKLKPPSAFQRLWRDDSTARLPDRTPVEMAPAPEVQPLAPEPSAPKPEIKPAIKPKIEKLSLESTKAFGAEAVSNASAKANYKGAQEAFISGKGGVKAVDTAAHTKLLHEAIDVHHATHGKAPSRFQVKAMAETLVHTPPAEVSRLKAADVGKMLSRDTHIDRLGHKLEARAAKTGQTKLLKNFDTKYPPATLPKVVEKAAEQAPKVKKSKFWKHTKRNLWKAGGAVKQFGGGAIKGAGKALGYSLLAGGAVAVGMGLLMRSRPSHEPLPERFNDMHDDPPPPLDFSLPPAELPSPVTEMAQPAMEKSWVDRISAQQDAPAQLRHMAP